MSRLAKIVLVTLTLAAAAFVVSFWFISRPASRTPVPPPDMNGDWVPANIGDDPYYQVATIRDGTIEVYWRLGSDDDLELYWAGTFGEPTTEKEPYVWESVNDLEKAKTSRRASRDEKKTFIYKKGELIYNVNVSHLKLSVSLVKKDG